MPGPSDNRVLVRNRHGAEKRVAPHRLSQLGASWTEVRGTSTRKRPAKAADESTPAVVPDNDSQEG